MDPIAHHFLLSLDAKHEFAVPVNPYSLFHLVFELRPPEDTEFPYVVTLWMFARLVGRGVRQFEVEVHAVPPGWDEDDDELEFVASYAPLTARFGDQPTAQSRAWQLPLIPFPRPGTYLFRLIWEGNTLATETITVFGV